MGFGFLYFLPFLETEGLKNVYHDLFGLFKRKLVIKQSFYCFYITDGKVIERLFTFRTHTKCCYNATNFLINKFHNKSEHILAYFVVLKMSMPMYIHMCRAFIMMDDGLNM